MMSERAVDLESQKVLLNAINSSLRRQNQILVTKCKPIQKTQQKPGILSKSLAISLMVSVSLAVFITSNTDLFFDPKSQEFKTNYTIQNLRGDKVETWTHWNVMDSEIIAVNIVNAEAVSEDKISAIKDAILSEKTLQIDDYLQHKAPKGTMSTYYEGWRGALLDAAKSPTTFSIPTNFVILESARGEGEITILLLTEKNGDGYTGYTKATIENNQILKSSITIYDADEISADQIGTIIRHEFGHALGLGHSTAPEDLMAPLIITSYPYISECNVKAISALYDGKNSDAVICDK